MPGVPCGTGQSACLAGSAVDQLLTECWVLCTPSGNFTEQQHGEVTFPDISAKVLEKTVQYFYYKLRHTNHSGPLPEFKIEPESALELLMAANFLDT